MTTFQKILTLASLTLLSSLPSSSFAALVWTPEKGWTAEGGITEKLLGKNLNLHASSNLEAMNLAKQEQENKNYLTALNLYESVYSNSPDSPLAPEALYQSGLIYIERHQYANAFSSFQDIIVKYPTYDHFNEVIKMQFEIASLLQKGNRPYYWGIIPGFKDYDGAIKYFESIVQHAPYSQYAPMALMNIADLAKEHKKPEDVVDALDRLVSNYPKHPLAPKAFVKIADAYINLVQGPSYDQGSTIKSINYYKDFLYLYSDDPLVQEAQQKLENAINLLAESKLTLGDFYYKYRNNFTAAKIYYNEAISISPDSHIALKAKKHLELISNNIPAPKTWVDVVFGRYKQPELPDYLEEAELAKREREKFESDTKELNLKSAKEGLEDALSGGPTPEHPPKPKDETPSQVLQKVKEEKQNK